MTKKNTTYASVRELADELGLCLAKTYQGLSDGTIPGIRLGNRWIIPRSAIADWLRTAGGKMKPAV